MITKKYNYDMRSSESPLFISALVWLAVGFAAWVLYRTFYQLPPSPPSPRVVDPVAASLKKRILLYSAHALERMWERNISFSEVEFVKKNGAVNWSKSKEANVYALEAKTPGNRDIRVLFSPSSQWFATVVTTIHLGA